jgi:predicted acetyltransferase
VDGRPVGIGKLRHYLNDKLRAVGGHIGYTIRPSERSKGYGVLILRELLTKAKHKGIEEALITCHETNTASRRVLEANDCKLVDIREGECYWTKNLSDGGVTNET